MIPCRAPFFATPGEGGWDASGGRRQKKKAKKSAAGFVDVYGEGVSAAPFSSHILLRPSLATCLVKRGCCWRTPGPEAYGADADGVPSQAVASASVQPGDGPIRIADVQNLVLWVLGEGCNPRWCFLKVRCLPACWEEEG